MSEIEAMQRYESMKTPFTVIHYDDNLVFCMGIFPDFITAIGAAYRYANDLVISCNRDNGSVGTLYDLEGEGGMGMQVVYSGNIKCNVFILSTKE